MKIFVDTKKQKLCFGAHTVRCAIGKNGTINGADGREGDGKTPLGTYPLRYGFYRADRLVLPKTHLLMHQVRKDDGWCDDPEDPAYNRLVKLPYPSRFENLWRDSHVYDIVIVLGHNDAPPMPGSGSAIFLHIARNGYRPTQGCVAIGKDDMLALLPHIRRSMEIEIAG